MNLLFLVGSLRVQSINHAAAQSSAELLPAHVTATHFGPLDQLPHFNPDIAESELPDSAARLRSLAKQSDGVLISCPEYAHGASGLMKTALEWLVGGTELSAKPVMLMNASTSLDGGQRARRWLCETLTVMGADVRPEWVSIGAAATKISGGRVTDPATVEHISHQLTAFVEYCDRRAASPSSQTPS